jgi:leucine dehydrogenase
MTLFDSPDFEGHEGVHAFFDEKTGLKSIIAIHSTARGPAAGGCRMWDYSSADAAVTDALRLSRACRTRTPWPTWTSAAARP